MVSIHVRPPEIEDRLMPGHWEGDLIKGKANASSVGTLVERTSGYLMLVKMHDATATSAVEGFSAALNRMPLAMRKSMTYDQGREMARHAEITQKTGVAIYLRPAQPLAARRQREHQWFDPPVPTQGHRLVETPPGRTGRHSPAIEHAPT